MGSVVVAARSDENAIASDVMTLAFANAREPGPGRHLSSSRWKNGMAKRGACNCVSWRSHPKHRLAMGE
jgi:hypothetical protein